MAKVKKTRKIRISTIILLSILVVLVWGITTYRYEIENILVNFFLRFFVSENVEIVDYKIPKLIDSKFTKQTNEILQRREESREIVVKGDDTGKVNLFVP